MGAKNTVWLIKHTKAFSTSTILRPFEYECIHLITTGILTLHDVLRRKCTTSVLSGTTQVSSSD